MQNSLRHVHENLLSAFRGNDEAVTFLAAEGANCAADQGLLLEALSSENRNFGEKSKFLGILRFARRKQEYSNYVLLMK